MTLYLDTSALAKLYIAEAHSEAVREAVAEAGQVATAVIAYTEARAALARRHRQGDLDKDAFRAAIGALDGDWASYTRLDVSEGLCRLAGVLAERHALRAYDAVHLAAALALSRERQDVRFLAFDAQLAKAARAVMPAFDSP